MLGEEVRHGRTNTVPSHLNVESKNVKAKVEWWFPMAGVVGKQEDAGQKVQNCSYAG